MSKADIIIVGAGIAGLSTAYALLSRRPGLSVIVLETGPAAGHGASWANGSMVHPSQATPWLEANCDNADLIARKTYRLAARSSEMLRANMDAFGIAARHRKSGCAKLYQSRAAMDADMQNLTPLFQEGLRAEVLTSGEIRARLPIAGAALSIAGGVIFPDDHTGPPRLYCAALIKRLNVAGATIHVNAHVADIQPGGVTLKDGSLWHADSVVLCAGAGNSVFKNHLSVTPVRGYSRTFDISAGRLPNMAIMDDTAHISVTPLGDHLRVSGGADIDPDDCLYDRLEAYACALLPGLSEDIQAARKSDWTAQRPMSDCGPVIGKIAPGIFANTGHGHMGWTLSAGAAELAVDAVLAG